MSLTTKSRFVLALLGLLVFAPAPLLAAAAGGAEVQDGPQTGTLQQIIPGHYIYSSGARVSGVIVTAEGVVVLDALSNEAMARHERQLIAATIRQPVRYLISSTFHGNYALGNVAYQDAIRIGHEDYKTDLIDMMKMENMTPAQQAAMLPHLTFRDRLTLTLGGKEIQILHIGRGHTRGDAVVFVPADRIVYLSEMFFDGRFPFMNSGYANWINAIDIALQLEADIFVPGQGPTAIASDPRMSRQALIRARQVLVDARDAVTREIARGATEEQAVANILLPQYQAMTGYQQQRAVLVRRLYQDLKGLLR
jgi:glyoxylase-like metal-dependent hydrolase (beta-lactamase superfamily II)